VGATHFELKFVNKNADQIFDMRLKGVNSESLGQTQRMVLKQRILHKINDKELGVTGNYEGQPIDSGTMEITDLQ